MFEIQPIKLLRGNHDDTAQTGSGCFMNVIAYLNGEPQITDNSPCVCPTIRPIAIWLNDLAIDKQRQKLLPFVLRAMGTATTDKLLLLERRDHLTKFARDMKDLALREGVEDTSWELVVINGLIERLQDCVFVSNETAGRAGSWAAKIARTAVTAISSALLSRPEIDTEKINNLHDEIFERGVKFMEDICPTLSEPNNVVIERANRLHELSMTESLE